jgi:hypothetical protein
VLVNKVSLHYIRHLSQINNYLFLGNATIKKMSSSIIYIMASLDSLCRSIRQKIDFIKYIAPKISSTSGRIDDVNRILRDIQNVEDIFNIKTSQLLVNDKLTGSVSTSEFINIITSEHIDNVIESAAKDLYNIITGGRKQTVVVTAGSSSKTKQPEAVLIKQLENHFDSMTIYDMYKKETRNFTHCEYCLNEMIVDPEKSELICNKCRLIKKIDGVSFQLSHTYGQDNQKIKSGSFKPDRHYLSWVIHIQAKENDEEIGDPNDESNLFGEKRIVEIKETLLRDGEILRMVDVYKIRKILKRKKLTKLNKNAPKIIKKITGISPPQMPENILNMSHMVFVKVIEIHERLHPNDKPNRNFYPYYIFKIWEILIPESNHNLRRILFYIYHQNQNTLDKNDEQWRHIIAELREMDIFKSIKDQLKFKKTLRYGILKYRE